MGVTATGGDPEGAGGTHVVTTAEAAANALEGRAGHDAAIVDATATGGDPGGGDGTPVGTTAGEAAQELEGRAGHDATIVGATADSAAVAQCSDVAARAAADTATSSTCGCAPA